MTNHLFFDQASENNHQSVTRSTRFQATRATCAAACFSTGSTFTNESPFDSKKSIARREKRTKLFLLWTFLIAAALAALLMTPAKLQADPSASDPYAALALIDPATSEATLNEAMNLYRQINKPVTELVKNFEEKDERALKSQISKIGTYFVLAKQIQRLGDRLIAMQEPAGTDISARGNELSTAVRNIAIAMAEDEAYLGPIRRITSSILTRKKSLERDIPKIERLAEKDQWEQVHRAIYDLIDDMDSLCVWLSSSSYISNLKPFMKLAQESDKHVDETLSTASIERLKAMAAAQSADYETLTKMTDEAIGSIHKSGTAQVAGRTMTGPELLYWFVSSWQTVQNRAIRLRAINWMLGTNGDSKMASNIQRLMNKFSDESSDRIIAIIQADTSSLPVEKVRDHYILYLATLGRLLPLLPDPDKTQAVFEKALATLVEKSPELVEEVRNYRAATSEILRWRKAWANKRAEFQWKYTDPESLTNRRTPIRGGSDLYQFHFGSCSPLKSAPTLIMDKSPDLLTANVVTGPLRGLGESGMAIGGYEKWTYALVKLPEEWKNEVEKLRQDLYCATGSGGAPLTLEAARAIISASEGHASLVGGKVTEITMQSQMPFFVSLPDLAGRLALLGPDLADSPNSSAMKGTISRVTIEPAWIVGPGFIIELTPPLVELPQSEEKAPQP